MRGPCLVNKLDAGWRFPATRKQRAPATVRAGDGFPRPLAGAVWSAPAALLVDAKPWQDCQPAAKARHAGALTLDKCVQTDIDFGDKHHVACFADAGFASWRGT